MCDMMQELIILLFLISCVYFSFSYEKQHYKIGGIFSDVNNEIAFRIAAYSRSNKYPLSELNLEPVTSIITSHNTLEAYRSTCTLLEVGISGLFGPNSMLSSPFVQSICDLKEIPHIETYRDFNIKRNDTLVNIYPHAKILSNLFVDLVEAYDWKHVIILYDDDDHLLNVQNLLDLNLYRGRTVVLKQLEADDESRNFRMMMIGLKKEEGNKFVIACSMEIIEEVLKQLQQVGMMTEIYSYIIANLDTQTVDLSPYQYAESNITLVRMINPEETEVMETAENIHKIRREKLLDEEDILFPGWKLKFETALIVDAVHLFYDVLYDLTIDKKKTIREQPIYCHRNDNWNEGYTITNLMKSKSMVGLTGLISFNNEGMRTDFLVDILELSLGGLVKVGNWNSTMRSLNIQRPSRTLHNFIEDNPFNRTFIVVISLSQPYGMLRETTTQLIGNDRYEGFGIDVITELSKILGFNYTFIVQEDGEYGTFNKSSQEWNGMIRKVLDGDADLAITDLTVTSEREKAVDFTSPFMNLGISILYRKPEPVPPSLFMFVSPFSAMVWLMLAVAYFLVSLAFFVMGRLSPTEWQNPYPCIEEPEYLVNQFSIRNSFWFTVGALMQQGSELAPISISTRTASGAWWFFVMIMCSSYTANLAAFLTVETLVTSFQDIEELAAQTEIKFGAKRNGATANYFRDSNLTIYQKVWSYMVHHPELMMETNEEGVKKVETENYAFLMESTTIEYQTERHCTLAQVGGLLDDKGYGIAMKKDSPYRNDLSRAVLQLQEQGILSGLKIKWWKEKRGGGNCASTKENSESTPLDLQNVGGVFLVLFVGTVLGFFGSIAEAAWANYKKTRRENISFKEEFLKELRFFFKFKQNVKELNAPSKDSSSSKNLMGSTKDSF